jgi:hypothetical protein
MRKKNYYDIIEYKAWKAHCKTEALRWFFENHRRDSTCERDEEAVAGICYFLEEISNETRMIHDMLGGDIERPSLETEVHDLSDYGGGYPKANLKELWRENKNHLAKIIKDGEKGGVPKQDA